MLNFPKAFSKNAENMNEINRFCNNNEKYVYKKKKNHFMNHCHLYNFNLEREISNCEHRISLKNASYRNRFGNSRYV